VFERFTDRARAVVVGAQAEAVALNHDYIGTEHVLLGLLRVRSGAAFELLGLFEVPVEAVRQRVEEIIGRGDGSEAGEHIPFTPRAKRVLEMSLREALQLGENYIGTEHILLGLLREGGGIGAQVLVERGVTLRAVSDRLDDVEREGPRGSLVRRVRAQPPEPIETEGEETITMPADHFARLMAEIARLRDLLRHQGIDPGEELPGFGDEEDPPIA
jgi:ATP-dependent Clp protease ATP-binding subunit ClpC